MYSQRHAGGKNTPKYKTVFLAEGNGSDLTKGICYHGLNQVHNTNKIIVFIFPWGQGCNSAKKHLLFLAEDLFLAEVQFRAFFLKNHLMQVQVIWDSGPLHSTSHLVDTSVAITGSDNARVNLPGKLITEDTGKQISEERDLQISMSQTV